MPIPAGLSPLPIPHRRRFQDFHGLIRHRVQDILLVASPYDSFILEEVSQLGVHTGEFSNLDLHYSPGLTGVSSGAEALALAREQSRFNLIVTAPQVRDMTALDLARRVRESGLSTPVVVLAFDRRELPQLLAPENGPQVDGVFLWQGDARILIAITKYIEDKLNVAHDTLTMGVQVILVVEDNVRYYSSFLPTIYEELLHHSQRLVAEGVNLSHKIHRMRARPKILLCTTFEEAWSAFESYQEDVMGVISDIEFPWNGETSPEAGLELTRRIRRSWTDVPVILHSSREEFAEMAAREGAGFLLKGSQVLLRELRRYMINDFGFGDFVFRRRDGHEVARAHNLKTMEEALPKVPSESIAFHAERNHFSKWLKARTEFAIADRIRPQKLSNFPGVEGLRRHLIQSLEEYRRERSQSMVAEFRRESFDTREDFYSLGGGSLGGKARGLSFMRMLLSDSGLRHSFKGIRVVVPACLVLATDLFDRFLDDNDLRTFAIDCEGEEEEINHRFHRATFPAEILADLRTFLERVHYPLAVRSSSLLEDSRYQPFSGVYATRMLPNDNPSLDVRLAGLTSAIKSVYASTLSRHAKSYIQATSFRLEEEKMGVILQRLVGSAHEDRFYPDFAGVARSHNFYPTGPLRSEDGIAAVALGFGRTVVEGGRCLRFSPRYPQHLVQFSTVADMLKNSQRRFWGLKLPGEQAGGDDEVQHETTYDLEAAENDGTLAALGSTYSHENRAVYDGIARSGLRLVSFASILKHGDFPLAEILERLLEVGSWGMGAPVEIEFAVNLSTAGGRPQEFGFLQLRPLSLSRETEELEIGDIQPGQLICASSSVMGNGMIDQVRDLLVVDRGRFDRSRSHDTALELAQLNARLDARGASYLLIGVGRWGSADPWLGIPVTWDQISGARAIVEAGFEDFKVTPSQGTHFFQNLTTFHVGYFTVNPDAGEGFVDWDWLAAQPAEVETATVRHLRLPAPAVVKMNGKRGQGVILKP